MQSTYLVIISRFNRVMACRHLPTSAPPSLRQGGGAILGEMAHPCRQTPPGCKSLDDVLFEMPACRHGLGVFLVVASSRLLDNVSHFLL